MTQFHQIEVKIRGFPFPLTKGELLIHGMTVGFFQRGIGLGLVEDLFNEGVISGTNRDTLENDISASHVDVNGPDLVVINDHGAASSGGILTAPEQNN